MERTGHQAVKRRAHQHQHGSQHHHQPILRKDLLQPITDHPLLHQQAHLKRLRHHPVHQPRLRHNHPGHQIHHRPDQVPAVDPVQGVEDLVVAAAAAEAEDGNRII